MSNYLTADVRVFLFLSMMAATVLGLLYTIFSVWATRFGSVSAIWAAFSFGLLVTLVAVSILYALYVLVTVTLERR